MNRVRETGISAAVLSILLALLWTAARPVSAQNPADYFTISYQPVSFSTSEVQGDRVFTATISGNVTCTNDLPVSISEATITARVVGESGGARVVLNPGYTTTIKPFPSKKGETVDIRQVVDLRFPAGAGSGEYTVAGEIVEGRVKVLTVNMEVTKYLPQKQSMGKVRYISTEDAPKPTSAPSATSAPVSQPAPAEVVPGWVWLLSAIAILTTAFNVIYFVKHRVR